MSGIFPISAEELSFLAKRDKRLAKTIEIVGPIKREVRTGAFQGLIHAICGQQISGKAHESIWKRFCARFDPDDAALIAKAPITALRECGLSERKAQYIGNIARLFHGGTLGEESLRGMGDNELRSHLVALPGVGPWTVDMLLIFTFLRKNILSCGDLGIQKGLQMLYRHKSLTPALFDRYHKRFSPLASIASFYLWEVASGKYPFWTCSGPKKRDQAKT